MTHPLRVALTGSTGFIGRRLVSQLTGLGHRVTALVRDPSDFEASLAERVVTLDLDSLVPGDESLLDALSQVDVLCHVAAYIPADMRDPQSAERCLRVNALSTLALVETAAKSGVKRFVNFSSGNIYRYAIEPVTEDATVYPSARASYYLTSKLAGELYVDHARARGAIEATTLRVSSVYGPSMKGGIIRTFCDRLGRGESVRVGDAGRYQTDLVYVDDVVRAAIAAIESTKTLPFVNVGSGVSTSMLTLARVIAELMGLSESLIEIDPPLATGHDPGFAPLDISRARAALAYTPTPLMDGLRMYLASR
ncbi:MAG: NAD(P)-dependent oxidoreductase [Deltaproteobacteria bacterium]|nr:NAD(P)-dependent oxidoreductase [Deltaproteobacteria bacterium]